MADEMILLKWAREHRDYIDDDADFHRPTHDGTFGPHRVVYETPTTCPTCLGTQKRACRGHYHKCDDCQEGLTKVTFGQLDECPLCWDIRMRNLGRVFGVVDELNRQAQKYKIILETKEN